MASKDQQPTATLRGYDFYKCIGKGTFGSAWLVRSKTDGQQYVAKQMFLTNLNERDRRNAENELQVLQSINHPNIVGYKDYFIEESGDDRVMYIIQEFCDGGDLLAAINERMRSPQVRPFTEEQASSILAQILLALQYLHDVRKIVHRDIKTENVFLMKDGTVKLGDFGLCRILASTEFAKTVCGTPNYFAPEMCTVGAAYNKKADVWAVGCTMYEMLNMARLFSGTDVFHLTRQITQYKDNATVNAIYSVELRSMVGQCLTSDPDRRPTVNTLLKQRILQSALRRLQPVVSRFPPIPFQEAQQAARKPQTAQTPPQKSPMFHNSPTKTPPLRPRSPPPTEAVHRAAQPPQQYNNGNTPAPPAVLPETCTAPPLPPKLQNDSNKWNAPAPAQGTNDPLDNAYVVQVIREIKAKRALDPSAATDLEMDPDANPRSFEPEHWVHTDTMPGMMTMTDVEYEELCRQLQGYNLNLAVVYTDGHQ